MPPVIFSNMVDGGDSSSSHSSSAKSTPTLDVVGIPICSSTNSTSLSTLGKTYHCQRCLNHGTEIPRKGHKRFCEYANCECLKCSLVEERKILNREINSEREKNASPLNVDKNDELNLKIRARNPKCARCGVHVKDVEPPPLKGHKKICPYQNCNCRKCKLVTRRRSIMAKQIHLRRTQKSKHCNSTNTEKSDTMGSTPKSSPTSSSAATAQISTVDLPTPPNLTSSLCPSSVPVTLRPSPTYPNVHCCHTAIINSLNHQHNIHQQQQHQQGCMQTSLSHLLSLNQQQSTLPPMCGHFHTNAAVGLPQSVVDSLYLNSNPSLSLPMITTAASPASSLLFSPTTASSLLSEILLQRTGLGLPPPNHHSMVSLSGMPVFPITNELVTTAIERMIAAAPSSWANQPYSSLATALRLPLFSNVAEEMHI